MHPIHDAAVRMALTPAALSALAPTSSARAAVSNLLEHQLADDALKLQAHLLQPGYAVAWVCGRARRHILDASDQQGLALAEAWLRDPLDTHRQQALDFAVSHRCATIGAWLAATAAWSAEDATRVQAAHAVVATLTRLAAIAPEGFVPARDACIRDALGLLDTVAPSP
ncbi:MAG: hypothetical protein GAK28_00655 [Luteibacter sp.]|uniref:DUF6931 family protein n=1 Tax=Luteibacter sp. TaxID=1886636 RepID=UPI0013803940|nr:hypothetical protein [Luteibacter sp.]KAF1009022.1 MAG: hypothetical protein GAK28_00655 [Luteibacter sp.]